MPIYIYKGNNQISANAIRNTKIVRALITKQSNKLRQEWGEALYYYTADGNNDITITGVISGNFSKELNIPKYIGQKKVTYIGSGAFTDCINAKKITIPRTVENIYKGAFSGCSSLESITIPFVGAKTRNISGKTYQYPFGYIFGTSSYDGSVATEQYYYESSNPNSMTSITCYIPSSLKSVTVTGRDILKGAFRNCTGLTSITISNIVTEIGEQAFAGCSGLTNFTIPNSVTTIGDSAFYNCTGLTSIEIPDSVTTIDVSAFERCTGLTSVTIPGSVTSTGWATFRFCTGLTSVSIVTGVTRIGQDAFYGCTGLTSITIPDSVRNIEAWALRDCEKLTSIEYNGPKERWNTITKGSLWNSGTGNYTIHCTDGDIPK